MPLRSGSCFLEDDIIEPLMLLKFSSLSHFNNALTFRFLPIYWGHRHRTPDAAETLLVEPRAFHARQWLFPCGMCSSDAAMWPGVWGVGVLVCVCVCVFMFVHAFIHNNRLRKEGGRSEATITPLGQQQVCVYLPAVSAWAFFYNDRFVSIYLLWVLEHFFTKTGLCVSIYLLWVLEHFFTMTDLCVSTFCECLSIFLQWQVCAYLSAVSAWAFFTMTGLCVSACCECLSIFLQWQVCVYLSTCCERLSNFLQWQVCEYLPAVSAWAFFYNDRFVYIYLPAVSAWALFYNYSMVVATGET